MKRWLNQYENELDRTRWVSSVGASTTLLFAVHQILAIRHSLSLAESVDGDALEGANREITFLLLIVALLVTRVAAVQVFRLKIRPWGHLTAFLVVSAIACYVWVENPVAGPTRICSDGRCFTIYDMARRSYFDSAAILYMLLSFFRMIWAAVNSVTKAPLE